MGKIIKAGVEHYFSGGIGSGSDIVILTQEEYDELVTNNTVESGVYYFIEDVNIEGGNNVVNDASDIIYDNSTSGLEADNVQGAIDEVNGDIAELNQKIGAVSLLVETNNNDGNTIIPFSEKLSNYRYVYVVCGYGTSNNAGVMFAPVSLFKLYNHTICNASDNTIKYYIQDITDTGAKIFYPENNGTHYIRVYGVG